MDIKLINILTMLEGITAQKEDYFCGKISRPNRSPLGIIGENWYGVISIAMLNTVKLLFAKISSKLRKLLVTNSQIIVTNNTRYK